MPELPEVQTIVHDLLESDLIGKKIKGISVYWERTIASSNVQNFKKQIINEKIREISRRGKFILFTLDNNSLLIHLRMTGKFFLNSLNKKTPHERVRLIFEDGRILHYDDQRKFGKWYLMPSTSEKFDSLGLEPLSSSFTFKAFAKLLKNSSQQIKPFLLNQRHIAGLGNIYVDESLWAAKIHPKQKTNSISLFKKKTLHQAIIDVLKNGIAHMGTTLGNKNANYFSVSGRRGGNQTQLKVFRREKLPCPRCGENIIKIKVAQRGTHICPNCQTFLET